MNSIKAIACSILLVLLVGCGGGGGSAGSVTAGSSSTTTGTGGSSGTAAATDLVVSLSGSSVNNGATNSIALSVQVLDASRNAISGALATVEVLDVLGGASVSGAPFRTASNGAVTVQISPGTSKINRTVVLKVTVGSLERSTAFQVIGTTLSAALIPGNPAPNSTATLSVTLLDSSNSPVVGEPVTVAGIAGLSVAPILTNLQGKAVFNVKAPSTDGNYTLKISAAGTSLDQPLQVSTPGSSGIAAAIGPIGSPSLSANPTVIGANIPGGTTNRTQIKAIFFRADNTPIQNVRVRFEIVPGPAGATLGAGESISSGSSLVFSDNSGVATTEYIAGTRSSPNNGVYVRACYSVSEFLPPNCPQFVIATFTVASKPLSLTLGDNNLLEKANDNLTYIKKFVLQVADAAGQPVANAQVSFTVDIYKYGKGSFYGRYPSDFIFTTPGGLDRNIQITPQDNLLDDTNFGANSWCASEDRNRNGVLDGASEDRNGNGTLEPRLADITISSIDGGNRTDANGVLVIRVRYPQNVATWLAYAVKATASTEGSEGTVIKRYRTTYVEGDQTNGSFLDAPYGVDLDCRSPN
jgi:hypothetical protein